MAKDLTVGSPSKGLVRFALPLILGNLLQQLYNMADMIVVGNRVGSSALAAVGASSSLAMFFVALAFGSSMGAGIAISQLFGAKRMGRMMTAISTSIIFFFALGVALTVLGLSLHRPLLRLMATPANVIDDAAQYIVIYFGGFIFLFMFNVFNAIFNALGDSKKPLIFLTISGAINVGLNLLFVIKYDMGVAGVAWGTVISQAVSVVMSAATLRVKLRKMNITEPHERFDSALLKTMIKVAGPSTIQQTIVSIGLICLQSVVNGFGDIAMAGYAAASKIDTLTVMPVVNAGVAMSTFTAQNMGAGKIERVGQGYRAGLKLVLAIGIGTAVILFFVGSPLIGIFVSGADSAARKAQVVAVGTQYLRISSAFYFLFGCMNIHTGILRGSGDMAGFLTAYVANFGFRVLVAFTLAKAVGMNIMAWSNATGWLLGLVFAFVRYRQGKWKKNMKI